MSKTLGELTAEIQFRTDMTMAEVAEKIGYSRTYLSAAIKDNATGKIYKVLLKEFADVLTTEGNKSEKITAIEAAIRVILDEIINLRHLVTKEKTELIALNLADKIKRLIILP